MSRTDALGRTTAYRYDAAGRLTGVTDAMGHEWDYEYDAAGNRTRVVDANAHAAGDPATGTATFGYDAAGRVTEVAYSDGTPGVTLAYDAAGRRNAMVDGAGTVSYDYDARGLVRSVTRDGGPGFAYAYDVAGRVIERRYPDGTRVGYGWDADGRLAVLTGADSTEARFGYDAAGHPVETLHGNGTLDARAFDAAGRVALVESFDAAGQPVASHRYGRDALGNPVVEEQLAEVVTYRYDDLDQLVEACHLPAGAVGDCGEQPASARYRYDYDAVGNRLEAEAPEGLTRYTYDPADRLATIEHDLGTVAVVHDANGNRLDDATRRYAYDLASNLVEVEMDGRTVRYAHDGDGVRLTATVTGPALPEATTAMTWDVNHPLPELALEHHDGEPLRRYVHGPDRRWRRQPPHGIRRSRRTVLLGLRPQPQRHLPRRHHRPHRRPDRPPDRRRRSHRRRGRRSRVPLCLSGGGSDDGRRFRTSLLGFELCGRSIGAGSLLPSRLG